MSTIRTAVPRYRPRQGPALLDAGFRPFFLAAALWAAAALPLWLLAFTGGIELPTALAPLTWHIHEMLYGFVAATLAGFLLTAIPNWTGRLPLQGRPLALLVLAWLAGRLATATSGWIGAGPAAALDLLFLATMLAVVLREIVAGRNWKNLPMAGAVALLLAGNALMHAEAAGLIPDRGLGWRLALAVLVLLVSLIGGRIIPSFTRNWLAKRDATALPAPFGRLDSLTLLATALAGAAWTADPDGAATALLTLAAGALQALRLARWRALATLAEPLVWILHLAYAWLPLGLVLLGLGHWWPALPPSLAIHALTAGALGSITLAVMTRATLGHTGRPLTAGAATLAIYLAITLAAATRLAAVLLPELMLPLLAVSGTAWVAAFAGFALAYGRALLTPRAAA
ncbi:uncharacterized protein involved in response to NO [Tistlia consotensis]|uniref:Uncharacterized protein involved in response to NO n=1 Tax=Tistlia consotensis USBA 355 TaxID=560819 RepID=A0A1Y6CA83_9PROT|nr:NnrS family protein [Tistlia consotensis]SMF51301.1 uncharacterized protein involved in response to NO [Tistlia consotensis USBA 355]SNR84475.1 uncharacterized protein involved in response to NO [Tistlia consotensis]